MSRAGEIHGNVSPAWRSNVVRQAPVVVPWLGRQGPAPAGQIVEVATLVCFADLLVDRALPLRQLAHRAAGFWFGATQTDSA